MTNETNRRAVLGAILAAGAIGAVPAAARAAGSHPDAKLLALASEIEAADREYELRERAINAAETVFFSIRPKEPERPTITYQAMEELIAQKRWDEITKFGAEVRKQEAALKAWQEDEIPRARRELGLLAAEEAQAEADGIRLSIRDEKLIPTRARTLEGLIFKARYAASHFKEDYDEEVMRSIVDDLLAIAAGEEAAHMNATAKRTMPLGLGIRVLSRLWLVHMRLRIARLLVWFVKTLRL